MVLVVKWSLMDGMHFIGGKTSKSGVKVQASTTVYGGALRKKSSGCRKRCASRNKEDQSSQDKD